MKKKIIEIIRLKKKIVDLSQSLHDSVFHFSLDPTKEKENEELEEYKKLLQREKNSLQKFENIFVKDKRKEEKTTILSPSDMTLAISLIKKGRKFQTLKRTFGITISEAKELYKKLAS